MLGILAGVVVAYDMAEGRATIRTRQELHRGDRVQLVGPNTDFDMALKAPRLCGPRCAKSEGHAQVIDVLTPPVEAGDLVFRVIGRRADTL